MTYLTVYVDFEEPAKYNKDLGDHRTIEEAQRACAAHAKQWFMPEGFDVASVEINWEDEENKELEGSPSVIAQGQRPVVYDMNKYKILINNKRNQRLVKDLTDEYYR